ncbi:hypothetical protein C8J57DRAFT_685557 [Mycena rebaudengoi]|nr:hypothetical protein C8J57DRAFT_685557 [Mycena rebaudengoi]
MQPEYHGVRRRCAWCPFWSFMSHCVPSAPVWMRMCSSPRTACASVPHLRSAQCQPTSSLVSIGFRPLPMSRRYGIPGSNGKTHQEHALRIRGDGASHRRRKPPSPPPPAAPSLIFSLLTSALRPRAPELRILHTIPASALAADPAPHHHHHRQRYREQPPPRPPPPSSPRLIPPYRTTPTRPPAPPATAIPPAHTHTYAASSTHTYVPPHVHPPQPRRARRMVDGLSALFLVDA